MDFKTISAKNFLSIGNKEVVYNFKNGITYVSGDNGSGKTLLFMDALHFILFGESYSGKKKNNLINWRNNNNCYVKLNVVQNGKEYTIIRSMKCKTEKEACVLDSENNVLCEGVTDTNEYVINLLKIDKKFFNHTVFLSAKYYESFLKISKEKKRDFIKRIFDFDVYDKMQAYIKEDIKEIKESINSIEHNINIEDEKYKLTKQNNINKLSTLKKEKEEYIQKLTILKNDIKDIDINKNRKIVTNYEQTNNNITLLKDKRNNINMKYNEYKVKSDLNKKITQRNEKYQKEIDVIKNDLKQYDKYNMDELGLELNDKQHEKYQLQIKIESSKKDLLVLKNKIYFFKINKICPECEHELNEVERKNKITQLKKEVFDLVDTIKENRTLLIELENRIKELNDIIYTSHNKKEDIERLESMMEQIQKFDVPKEKIDESIEKLNNKINELTEKLNSNIDLVTMQIKSYEEYEIKKVSIEENINKINSKIKLIDRKDEKDIKNNIVNLNIEKTDIKSNLSLLNKLLLCVHDNGIKKYIISKYVPVLNKIISKYINIIGSKFNLKFDKNGMDINLLFRNKKVEYNQLSGGQSQKIDLVLLFTFIEFKKLKDNNVFPLNIYDEILDSSLDKDGVEGLVNILKHVKEQIPNIIIISHGQNIHNFADNIVKVELKNGFSDYTFN